MKANVQGVGLYWTKNPGGGFVYGGGVDYGYVYGY